MYIGVVLRFKAVRIHTYICIQLCVDVSKLYTDVVGYSKLVIGVVDCTEAVSECSRRY